METLGSPAAVIAAIREEAAIEAEQAERRVAEELARAGGAEAAPAAPGAASEPRLAAARRRAHEALAQEDWLDGRAALEVREAWMQRAAAEGRRLLAEARDPAVRRARLHAAALAALARLPGDAFVVACAEAEAPLVDAAALAREAGAAAGGALVAVRVLAEAEIEAGGCVVRTADGRLAIDESIDARARRLEPAWRAALAEEYGA